MGLFRTTVAILVLVLSFGGGCASAASVRLVHTHSGFGLLFVLASDVHGNLYVADQKHSAIIKLSSSGHVLLRDSMPKQCGISGLAASSSGDVFAVANCRSLVYHFSPSGRLVQTFGRQPPGPGGVALDGQGHVYVTYGPPSGAPPPPPPPNSHPGAKILTPENRFVEFTPTGTALRTVKLARLHQAWGIAVDGRGNVFVTGTEALMKVSSTGHVLGRWNAVVPPKRKFALPGQPAVDSQGNVYVIDGPGNILKVSAAGRMLGAIVRHGSGANALQQPVGLSIDGSGHLFVGDSGPNRIKEFSLTGKLLAIWSP